MALDSRAAGGVASAPQAAERRAHVTAVVGPPNSGKSTLFNRLTGLRQKVANFPGVTVEQRVGRAQLGSGREILLVDLPGIYSLDPHSEDERVTRDVLYGRMHDIARPDSILLVLDATNLGRHLVLAAPILSLGIPTLIILNMADDLRARGGSVDVAAFRAVQPTARLNQIVLQSFALLFTPAAARLFARDDREGINTLYWQNAAWMAIFSFPIFALTFSLAGPITVSNTGGWGNYTTLTAGNVTLSAGQHKMRLVMDTNGATGYVGNLDWVAFRA